MAAMTDNRDYECVICREVYDTPKILPCYHLACRDCVRSWLARARKGGGGCPLCRATILPPSHPPQGDLDSAVDALPTNVLIQSLVKSRQVVTGPRVCAVCPGGTATASFYCFECGVKLCATCSVQHRKSPGTRKHELQDLKALTAQEVAAHFRWSCPHHPDMLVTAHCGKHGQLLCVLCEATKHRSCRDVRRIGEVARQKRREGGQLVKRWRAKEAALAEQIKSRKDKYDQQQKEAKMVFDQLHTMLDRRYQELYDVIQRQKDGDVDLEKARATMTSHILIMEQTLVSTSDDVMLQMTKELESRSVEVESACGRADNLEDVQDLQLDGQRISNIKSALSALGQERAVPPKATAVCAPAPATSTTTRISPGMPVISPSTPTVRTTSSSSPTTMSVTRHSVPPPRVASEEPADWLSAASTTTRISSGMPVISPSTPTVRTTSSSSPTTMSVTRHSAPPPRVASEEPADWLSAASTTTRISSGMPVISPSTPTVRTTSSSSPTTMSVTRHSAPPPRVASEEPVVWLIPSPIFEDRIMLDDPTVKIRMRRGKRLRYGKRAIDRFSCERRLGYMVHVYEDVHPLDDMMPEYEDSHPLACPLLTLFSLAAIYLMFLGRESMDG